MGNPANDFKKIQMNRDGLKLKGPEKKTRVTIRISESLSAKMESLVERTGARNIQDVIKHSLEFYDAVIAEAEAGKDITVSDPKNKSAKYPLFVRK